MFIRRYAPRVINSYYATVDGDGGGDTGGGGTNGGHGGEGNTPTPPPATPDWGAFASSLDTLNSQLGGKLDTLVDQVRSASTPADPDPDPVDLDALSRQELVAHVVGSMTKTFETLLADKLNPVLERVNTVHTDVVVDRAKSEIGSLRAEHKDFSDWNTEIVGLAKQHPSLSITECYRLAKVSNPAKATELDRKYNPPAPPARKPFSFTPGNTGNNGTKVLSAEQAGREAYTEVAARHPGVLALLSE